MSDDHNEAMRLAEWLRQNSSGVYRPAAEAADLLTRQAAELDTLRAEVERLQDTITGFCNGQKWAVDAWKNAKHNKPLFDAARAIEEAKEAK